MNEIVQNQSNDGNQESPSWLHEFNDKFCDSRKTVKDGILQLSEYQRNAVVDFFIKHGYDDGESDKTNHK